MSVLVACSYEVGAQPFRIAEALDRHGVAVRYLSLAPASAGHDSTRFHHGDRHEPWDLSPLLAPAASRPRDLVRRLAAAGRELGIRAAFATGPEAWVLGRAGIPYHYWSYGADLDTHSFRPLWPEGYPAYRRPWAFARFALGARRPQRRSLREARAVMIAPYQKPALDRLCPGKPLFFLPHLLSVEDPAALASRRETERGEVRARVGADRFVFSATRHVWCGAMAGYSDDKGNDVAIRAFAHYRSRGGDPHVRLALVRKGPDAVASQRLAADLGIDGAVAWLEEMPRHELARLYRAAELCLGQFGTPVIAYAMLEPLAQGTPCLSHFAFPHPGVPGYPVAPPGCVDAAPEALAGELARLLGDEAARRAQGEQSWRWVREHCSEERFVASFRACFGLGS